MVFILTIILRLILEKIQLMNKNFGTTIILSSISDKILKLFTSVNIYLENGYVSKIRAGSSNRSANNKYKTTRKKYKKVEVVVD